MKKPKIEITDNRSKYYLDKINYDVDKFFDNATQKDIEELLIKSRQLK